jgi:hypothetical protein
MPDTQHPAYLAMIRARVCTAFMADRRIDNRIMGAHLDEDATVEVMELRDGKLLYNPTEIARMQRCVDGTMTIAKAIIAVFEKEPANA